MGQVEHVFVVEGLLAVVARHEPLDLEQGHADDPRHDGRAGQARGSLGVRGSRARRAAPPPQPSDSGMCRFTSL